jgi:hypothetical protein
MKASRLSAVLFVGTLLLSASAFAGDTNKKSLHLYETVSVEGKQLPPGDYKVQWSGSGPSVQLNILKGKDTVATVSAQVVNESASNTQDGYTLRPAQNGSQELEGIFFSGKNYTLEIQSAANTSSGTSSGGTH